MDSKTTGNPEENGRVPLRDIAGTFVDLAPFGEGWWESASCPLCGVTNIEGDPIFRVFPGDGHGPDPGEMFSCGHCKESGDAADFVRLKFSEAPASGEALTDLGNSERLIARHGGDLRYFHDWRKWYVWDGTRWCRDGGGAVKERTKDTVRSIYDEAGKAGTEGERKALASHATRSEARQRIEAMISLAESSVPVGAEELDADPRLLNAANGTVDLRTGELRKHAREDLITKLAPVEYDPDAEAPIFEAFLERILPSKALRDFLRRVVGYAAAGSTSEEILTIFHGAGANGKSTLVNTIMKALGDYATQAAPDLLLAKRGSHPTELADLFGARFVASVETDDGRRLAEGLVKQLTGRDPIKARRMREDFWQFDPTHTVFLATNHKPEVRGTDHAIWRRIKRIPFDVQIPEEEQDARLAEKLRKELPGVLAWIVRGCLEYQRDGLGEPEEVKEATASYRAEMDVLAAFIEEECVVDAAAWAKFADLYGAYTRWCEDANERAETKRQFGTRLRERGFEPGRGTNNVPIRVGIGLRDDRHPDPSPDPGPEREATVTQEEENYPRVISSNTDTYGEYVEGSYPSYPENTIDSKNPPHRALYENEGNYSNYSNSPPAGAEEIERVFRRRNVFPAVRSNLDAYLEEPGSPTRLQALCRAVCRAAGLDPERWEEYEAAVHLEAAKVQQARQRAEDEQRGA